MLGFCGGSSASRLAPLPLPHSWFFCPVSRSAGVIARKTCWPTTNFYDATARIAPRVLLPNWLSATRISSIPQRSTNSMAILIWRGMWPRWCLPIWPSRQPCCSHPCQWPDGSTPAPGSRRRSSFGQNCADRLVSKTPLQWMTLILHLICQATMPPDSARLSKRRCRAWMRRIARRYCCAILRIEISSRWEPLWLSRTMRPESESSERLNERRSRCHKVNYFPAADGISCAPAHLRRALVSVSSVAPRALP